MTGVEHKTESSSWYDFAQELDAAAQEGWSLHSWSLNDGGVYYVLTRPLPLEPNQDPDEDDGIVWVEAEGGFVDRRKG